MTEVEHRLHAVVTIPSYYSLVARMNFRRQQLGGSHRLSSHVKRLLESERMGNLMQNDISTKGAEKTMGMLAAARSKLAGRVTVPPKRYWRSKLMGTQEISINDNKYALGFISNNL
ncbi:hypothetical protein NECAME_11752 [Necator americanus]|uniref:Uncharacterized protein n=1 Tax=Necator americanus TaxID=51031 RepID=W2T5R8_NECAM|nr:hypothetical protein NECAME_11752 [Necator americanus]ETN76297.1 hypothetical protein NECAME_11752 [Necator americanus]